MGGGCVTHGEMRNEYNILLKSQKVRDHPKDPDIHWRIILKWILGVWGFPTQSFLHAEIHIGIHVKCPFIV
jgi:hypothetical protein